MVRFDILYGKNTVCWWYGVMVRCGGCIMWLNIANVVVWYVSVYIRSVRAEYVEGISYVMNSYNMSII